MKNTLKIILGFTFMIGLGLLVFYVVDGENLVDSMSNKAQVKK